MWNLEQPNRRWCICCLLLACWATSATAQPQPHSLSWQEVRDKFQANNPTLRAAQIGIDESRAQEITAYLRPNPDLTGTFDQMNFFSTQPPPSGGPGIYSPFAYALPSASTDLPSITGFAANAPRLPRPKMAVPLVITATKLPLVV